MIRRALAAVLSAALCAPGPAAAQTVRAVVPAAPVAGASGAAGSVQGVSAVSALPFPSSLAPLWAPALQPGPVTPQGLAPQTAAAPSLAAPALGQHVASLPVTEGRAASLALPQAAVAVDGRAVPARAAPPGRLAATARAATRTLQTALRALAGDERAAALMPGLARLGSSVRAPRADAAADAQRSQADTHFATKAAFDAEDADPWAFEPLATPPNWTGKRRGRGGSGGGRGGKGGKGGGEEVPDPKYPSRDIRLNDAVLPSVAMRPDRPIEPLIVQAIDAAQKSIHIAAYEFKLREIVKALRRARERGVEVHIVVDWSNTFPRKREGSDYTPHRSMELQAILNEGFDVTILRGAWRYGIQHNKFMVFDGKVAEFGSFNYAWTAEHHHFENANFTDDKKHVEALLGYWQYLRRLSAPFDQARARDWPRENPAPPADAQPSVEFNGVKLPAFFFSPNKGSEDWIVRAIDAARESLDLTMFTFRSTKIAEAILRAKRRGVKVRILLDRSQADSETTSVYRDFFAYHKVKVKIIAGPDPKGPEWAQKDHNKFMVVDGKLVETGSMNFTKNAASNNFENGHFTTDKVDVAAYRAFFEDMYKDRSAKAPEAPEREPKLPTDAELEAELLLEPEPAPPAPVWPQLPKAGEVRFNGEAFPRAAVRPQDPVRDTLAQAIRATQKTLKIALYEFTLPDTLEALREAKRKGVKVEILVDNLHMYPKGLDHTGKPRQRSPQLQALLDDGFTVRVLRGIRAQGAMHNKLALFDGKMLELGSYNWAMTAEEHHFENVIFTDAAERLAFYEKYFQWMWDNSLTVEEAKDADWKKHRPQTPPPADAASLTFNGTKLPLSVGSPDGGVEAAIIKAIEAARVSVDIAMFSFYSKPIADALLAAKERAVHVRLALDENQAKLMKLDEWFAYHDFDVRILAGPDDDGNVMFEKQHNKFMVVDGKLVETGSFNYTPNAEENNFDNANFFLDDPLAAVFNAYFEMLFDRGWKPKKPAQPPLGAGEGDADGAGTEFFESLARASGGWEE